MTLTITPKGLGGYADPEYTISRIHVLHNVQGVATVNTTLAQYKTWAAGRLLGARAKVITAGTTSGAQYTIKIGTSSVGSLLPYSQAADSFVDGSVTPTDFNAGDIIYIIEASNDATSKIDVELFYQRTFE